MLPRARYGEIPVHYNKTSLSLYKDTVYGPSSHSLGSFNKTTRSSVSFELSSHYAPCALSTLMYAHFGALTATWKTETKRNKVSEIDLVTHWKLVKDRRRSPRATMSTGRERALVQWLKLPAWKFGHSRFEPRSGKKVSMKQNVFSLLTRKKKTPAFGFRILCPQSSVISLISSSSGGFPISLCMPKTPFILFH